MFVLDTIANDKHFLNSTLKWLHVFFSLYLLRHMRRFARFGAIFTI